MMKNLVFFLFGALLATCFWFYMGYLQVDGNKLEKYLHHDAASKEVVDEPKEMINETLEQPSATPLAEKPEQKVVEKTVEKPAKKAEEKPAQKKADKKVEEPVQKEASQPTTQNAQQVPANVGEQPQEKPAQSEVVEQVTQPSIVGRWRLPNPVGYNEQNKMLSFDEYGTFKDYYSVSSGLSRDYTYIIQGNVLKYKDKYDRTYDKSFQFKVSAQNGKDYLEIFGSADFGGKWVRSK